MKSAERMGWRVLLDQPCPAAAQMTRDQELAEEPIPTVRVFRWNPPGVSWGWKQRIPGWLASGLERERSLEGVERPTGGGVAFHGSDVSVSVVMPRHPLLSVRALMDAVCRSAVRLCESSGVNASVHLEAPSADSASAWVRPPALRDVPVLKHAPPDASLCEAKRRGCATARGHVAPGRGTNVTRDPSIGRIQVCLTEPSPYAVLIGARKVAGFALRRYPLTWLVQGSLLVRPLPEPLVAAIPQDVQGQLRRRAVSLSEAAREPLAEQAVAERWAASWSAWL